MIKGVQTASRVLLDTLSMTHEVHKEQTSGNNVQQEFSKTNPVRIR